MPDEQRRQVGSFPVLEHRSRFRKAAYRMTGTLEQALDDSGETILLVVRVPLLGLTLGSLSPELVRAGV